MTHLKRIILGILILSILAIIILLFSLFTSGNLFKSDASIFEANWDIDLPNGIEAVYSKKGPTDFQGHGSRYAVFKMKNSAGSSLLYGISLSKKAEIEKAITDILGNIDVLQDNYPNFTHKYEWKLLTKHSYKLYIVYDIDSSLLYLIQDMP